MPKRAKKPIARQSKIPMSSSGKVPGHGTMSHVDASGPVYFSSVTVRNVRCFGDEPQTLNLSTTGGESWAPWTIVLGNNGTGKSTLLQVLASVRVSEIGQADQKRYRIGVKFDDDQLLRMVRTWPSNVDGFLRHHSDEPSWSFPDLSLLRLKFFLESGPFAGAVKQRKGLEQLEQVVAFPDPRLTHFTRNRGLVSKPDLLIAGYGAWRRLGNYYGTPSSVGDARKHLFDEYAELLDAEQWLRDADYSAEKDSEIQSALRKRFEQVRETLLNLLPDVLQIRISTPTTNEPSPRALFTTPYGEVELRQLGFGYQSLIAWVVDFAAGMFEAFPNSDNPLAEPAVCLIDEIDLHLHPSWQRKVMFYLKERFPKTQFIATAHSPLIVQAAADMKANVAVLQREGDHVVIHNNPVDVLGWRADQILSSELFDELPPRSDKVQKAVDERTRLLSKSKLTAADKARIKVLDDIVNALPIGTLIQPGYFWLAYEWSNLTLSCQICNQRGKKNYFPLLNPAHRARSHRDLLDNEQSVLVNPVAEEPQQFIGFREEVAFGLDNRAQASISTFGLNRDLILERRREHLVALRDRWTTLVQLEERADELDANMQATLRDIRERLLATAHPTSEFSAMSAAFLKSVGALA